MHLTFDSIFKRLLLVILVVAIGIILLYTAFFHAQSQQKTVVIYLIIVQTFVLLTFLAFRNQRAYRRRSVKKLKNPRLEENSFSVAQLLLKDYEYIASTCSEAMNDRHTMVNYFLLIVGAVFTVIATQMNMQAFQTQHVREMLVIVALVLNFIGWLYFMHIIRLRQSWHGSAMAMNQIKEFFIQNGRLPDEIARSAFLWDTKSVPRAGRKSNVFYYSAVVISFISSVLLTLGSAIASPESAQFSLPAFSVIIGIYHFIFQILCYSLFLDYVRARTR
ncbi:MAG: hypothetical protein V2J62_08375 [candidate division KSB1 bacterium]|jgi:hypothetical protein|nr:hypothetical protein [candidate division KSB1 bacterium]